MQRTAHVADACRVSWTRLNGRSTLGARKTKTKTIQHLPAFTVVYCVVGMYIRAHKIGDSLLPPNIYYTVQDQ